MDRRCGDERAAAGAPGRARRGAERRRAAVGRAGVPRDAAGARGDRAAVRARPARLARAARARRRVARPLRRGVRVAELDQVGVDAVRSRACRGASAITAKAASGCSPNACATRRGKPPMVAFYGALAGGGVGRRCEAASCHRRRDARGRAAQRAVSNDGAYWVLRARRRIRPGEVLAGRTLRRARRRAVRASRTAGRAARLGEGSAAVRNDRRRRARRMPRARRPDVAARGDGADRRGARHGQQRLGADARGRRVSACRRSRCSARPARCTRRR